MSREIGREAEGSSDRDGGSGCDIFWEFVHLGSGQAGWKVCMGLDMMQRSLAFI